MASTQQTAEQHTQKQLIIELLLERLVPLVEWWSRLATVALPKIPHSGSGVNNCSRLQNRAAN